MTCMYYVDIKVFTLSTGDRKLEFKRKKTEVDAIIETIQCNEKDATRPDNVSDTEGEGIPPKSSTFLLVLQTEF